MERQINFWIPQIIKIPENVILVDDVISTGTTLNSCAKFLKENGVKKVYVIALARHGEEENKRV